MIGSLSMSWRVHGQHAPTPPRPADRPTRAAATACRRVVPVTSHTACPIACRWTGVMRGVSR